MRVGRNDPCPCGSGKKYKKCCLGKDEAPAPGERTIGEMARGKETIDHSVRDAGPAGRRALMDDPDWRPLILRRLVAWTYEGGQDAELQRARDRFGDHASWEDWAHRMMQDAVSAWILFHHITANGQTFVENYLTEFGADYPAAEREFLARLAAERFRVVEVQDVRVNDVVTIKDLYTEEAIDVQPRWGANLLARWDLLVVRLRAYQNHLVFDAAIPIDRTWKHLFFEALDESVVDLRKKVEPRADASSVLTILLPELIDLILDGHRLSLRPPEFRTTDNEELVFCKATYRVVDAPAVREALAKHRSFAADERGGFTWLSGHRRKGPLAPGEIVLGNVGFTGDKLVLETKSKERLKKGKTLLAKTAGAHLQHLADSFEDPQQALQADKHPAPPPESTIPPEIERQLLAQFLDDHYRKWPDEKLPALRGMTPRQASRNAAMRPVLVDLIKSIENQSARSPQSLAYDFSWIWKELGLDKS
jgi:hypothetical protein